MKKINLILLTLAIGLIFLVSCNKDKNLMDSLTDETNSPMVSKFADNVGAVCIMDNAANGNNIILYKRSPSGKLKKIGSFATGGMGTGEGLGTQGALVLGNGYLFASNAGSSEISVFKAGSEGLIWVDKVSSHGSKPVSLTVYGHWLYAVNAGGDGNISGFEIGTNGHLTYLDGSDRPLSSSASDPGQISFNPNGKQLVVTEKATNIIMTYDVNANGLPSTGVAHQSTGNTPFGFDFGIHNEMIVSNAEGGEEELSSLTSYSLSNSGALNVINGPVPTQETAACWI